MAVSTLDVVNEALLTYLGSAAIQDIDEQSAQAAVCRKQFPTAMAEVLSEFRWTEVRAVASLARLDLPASPYWAYAYALPADMLVAWRLLGPDRVIIPYEFSLHPDPTVPERVLWTSVTAPVLEYSSNRLPVGAYSPDLRALIALKLATKLAVPIKKDAKLWQTLDQKYRQELSAVSTRDANSSPEFIDTEFIPEFIRARL